MAIIKNPLTIVQSGGGSGGGSVELGTYNRIGQPFVVGETCTSIYLNETLSLEEILQILARLPQTDIIMDMPCYKICEFTTGNILFVFYMEGMAMCALTNADVTDVESMLLYVVGADYVLAPALPNISYQVASIGSSNDILSSFISNGEFTKGDVFITKDTISGNYETKSLRYPNDVVDKQINTINKEDKTILTEITNLPVFIGGINYSLATAQIEYYGMCQNAIYGEDPYEEGVVFRQTRYGGSDIVPLQGGKDLKLTKVRIISSTFPVTLTFYYNKLAPNTKNVVVDASMQPQEVQVPVYEGANCYRIDASETD